MKLLELIINNVPREKIHPDANFFAQDWCNYGKKAAGFSERPSVVANEWDGENYINGSSLNLPILSEDAATTIITREELMRAYDLVEQGYTLCFGGDCPVDLSAIVDVVLRDYHHSETHFAKEVKWSEDGLSDDVIAYKVVEIENTQIEIAKGVVTLFDAESLMRDISNSMPEMMAADMVELADYLIAQGWGKHE